MIAFSCVFRQRDHEKLVIPCPLICFAPSRSAVISLTDSANRNYSSVPWVSTLTGPKETTEASSQIWPVLSPEVNQINVQRPASRSAEPALGPIVRTGAMCQSTRHAGGVWVVGENRNRPEQHSFVGQQPQHFFPFRKQLQTMSSHCNDTLTFQWSG